MWGFRLQGLVHLGLSLPNIGAIIMRIGLCGQYYSIYNHNKDYTITL